MDDKTLELANNLIDKLSGELGVAKEVLWGALIKQAPIDYVTNTLQTILLGVLLFVAFHYMKYLPPEVYRETESGYNEWHPGGWMLAIAGGFLTVYCVARLFCILDITPLINPEYWALNELLSYFKKGE